MAQELLEAAAADGDSGGADDGHAAEAGSDAADAAGGMEAASDMAAPAISAGGVSSQAEQQLQPVQQGLRRRGLGGAEDSDGSEQTQALSMLPALSLGASLSQRDRGAGEVPEREGPGGRSGGGRQSAGRHNEAFQFRSSPRPSGSADWN